MLSATRAVHSGAIEQRLVLPKWLFFVCVVPGIKKRGLALRFLQVRQVFVEQVLPNRAVVRLRVRRLWLFLGLQKRDHFWTFDLRVFRRRLRQHHRKVHLSRLKRH